MFNQTVKLRKGLEDALPDYIAGKEIEKLMKMVEEVEEGELWFNHNLMR